LPLQSQSLKVLFATPECAPLVKTGGLGDVSAALPAALRALGIDARVLLPGYSAVLEADTAAVEAARLTVLDQPVRLLESKLPSGVPLIIVDSPALYVRGGGPYQADDGDDWTDNALRFGVLSKVAALLGAAESPLEWRPDVVHCNDWPTALAPAYLRFAPRPHAATLTTVHNLAFQGLFEEAEIAQLGLAPESLGTEGLEFYGRVSFLKGGLVYSDAINTVSPTYAREIQTPELGFGLDGVLRSRANVLYGVLNGIDTALWNPQTDPWIPSRYGPLTLERKLDDKLALKQRLGLAGKSDVPLMAMVTRLTHQKGVDLVTAAADALLAFPAQLVIVGTGERELMEMVKAMQERHPQSVATFIGFDEPLAHLVEAGADMFLMPSRFEPCGMNQMYSQRYGTPPIVNATGGLMDTVTDDTWAPPSAAASTASMAAKAAGFLMREATSDALVETVGRAMAAWRMPKRWRTLQLNGMAKDFGWTAAAKQYAAIYARIKPTS
jgi:starch synthase